MHFFRYLVTFLVLIIVYLFSFSKCIIYSCIVYWRWYSLYTKCIIRNTSYLYLHAFFSNFQYMFFFSFHLKTDDWYAFIGLFHLKSLLDSKVVVSRSMTRSANKVVKGFIVSHSLNGISLVIFTYWRIAISAFQVVDYLNLYFIIFIIFQRFLLRNSLLVHFYLKFFFTREEFRSKAFTLL